ncbi:MAG: hypothetical protein M1821_001261 [Bathelium mastoideum]|nr:MAG: hypothetical protein M1821_001261 [Bathelium mastoideum]
MIDSIPTKTTVLVIGAGPGGAYTACALAREGIDVTLLESDKFPRYHIGESMVPSIRHFLKLVDLDKTFDAYGFKVKTGAAFKLTKGDTKHAYTDFILKTGRDSYAWNVIRAESDNLIFQHAGKCGAHTFDETKVSEIQFEPVTSKDVVGEEATEGADDPGRPVSATWTRKDGTTGDIKFDYLVDASGRAGIVSTKYLKNRSFNGELKNVATWGYWRGALSYGVGTAKEGQPFFEALADGSGWVWFIPLHNGTHSVGVVMKQDKATAKKQARDLPAREFYTSCITQDSPGIAHLLREAHLDSELKHASDWSYSASRYAGPYYRIVGDAGAFIDPYFSSGCHLAFSGALSAAVTICASIKGQASEYFCWDWHSHLVAQRYTRFLLVVLSATKQIRQQDVPVLNDFKGDNFDHAFNLIRPVIQGLSDVSGGATREEVDDAVNLSLKAVGKDNPEEKAKVEASLEKVNGNQGNAKDGEWQDVIADQMQHHEAGVLKLVKSVLGDFFAENKHNGMSASVQRGSLGLVPTQVGDIRPQSNMIEKVDVKQLMDLKAAEDQPAIIEVGAT